MFLMKTIIFTLRGLGLAEILFSDLNLSNVILIMNLVFMKRLSDELPHLMYPAIFISHLIVSFFYHPLYSSICCVNHASGQSNCGQYHIVLVPTRPAQWSHFGLWAAILWEGNKSSNTNTLKIVHLFSQKRDELQKIL